MFIRKKIERERERERVHILTTILDKGIPRLPKEHPKANLNDAQLASSRQSV